MTWRVFNGHATKPTWKALHRQAPGKATLDFGRIDGILVTIKPRVPGVESGDAPDAVQGA